MLKPPYLFTQEDKDLIFSIIKWLLKKREIFCEIRKSRLNPSDKQKFWIKSGIFRGLAEVFLIDWNESDPQKTAQEVYDKFIKYFDN